MSRIPEIQSLCFVADELLLVSFTWIGLRYLAIETASVRASVSSEAGS